MMTRKFEAGQKVEVPLSQMVPGQSGWIANFAGEDRLNQRLMEMGLLLDEKIEVLHQAPFGGDPIAIQVRGSVLALRRSEAQAVLVVKVPQL